MAFCLDANIFIEGNRRRFPLDLFPVFWTKLADEGTAGRLLSIDEVFRELQKAHDALATWAGDHHALFLRNDDAATIAALQLVHDAIEAKHPPYREEAKTKFLGGADPWLIAYCKAHGHTLVTEETPAPSSLKSVKIPDIAAAVGVPVMTLNQMLRALQITFS